MASLDYFIVYVLATLSIQVLELPADVMLAVVLSEASTASFQGCREELAQGV